MRVLAAVLVLAVSLPLSAQPLKNVQILTGLSRPEIQRVMNEMRAGLGVHCHYCHANDDTHGASDTKPEKARAREMMRMVIDLNARHFGGKPVVTCFTCHNGKPRPALLPPLPQAIPPDQPAPVEARSFPPATAVIQKYVAAVGREIPPGTPRLFRGTRITASGATIGMTLAQDGEKLRSDLEWPDGSTATQALDANGGWVRDKNGARDLSPDDVIAARMGARAFAPFHTSSIGGDAKVVDSETLGGRSAWVVATPAARYWFDAASGLLLRRVVYFDSPMGRIPEQTDFDDYRDVGGAKLPFLTRIALVDPWLSGARQAETIQVGVAMPEDTWKR